MVGLSPWLLDDGDLVSPGAEAIAEELIDALSDTVDGLDAAIGALEDRRLVGALRELRAEHEEMLAEVTSLAMQHGLSPEEADDGTLGGALRRSWTKLANALTAGDEAILDAVESGEGEAVQVYERAADAGLPGDLEELVHRHLPRLVEAHDEVERLAS